MVLESRLPAPLAQASLFMEVFLDFRQRDGNRPGDDAERLLACYQKALGHELPNYLVALQGLARVVEMESADRLDDEAREYLQRLAALTRRVDEFVRALAQLGRWARDPGPTVAVCISEVVREAIAEANLLSAGLLVEYDEPKDLPAVAAPRMALYQVVAHLLRNASRAVADRALRVVVDCRPVEGAVEVEVTDNGVGIPGEKRGQLFDPFSGGRSTGGNGLGLFLVRQLVAGWGGALRVRSEVGQGTAVAFLVPRS